MGEKLTDSWESLDGGSQTEVINVSDEGFRIGRGQDVLWRRDGLSLEEGRRRRRGRRGGDGQHWRLRRGKLLRRHRGVSSGHRDEPEQKYESF